MSNIVAVEGIGGSGKSTIIREISKRGYQVIPELSKDLKNEFPDFSTDLEEAIRANRWFLEQEFVRCDEARMLAKKGNVIADRWYHSIFAVSYARNKLFGTEDGEVLQEEISSALEQNVLFCPKMIIVDVPVDLAMERLERRYGNKHFMEEFQIGNPRMLSKEREYYLDLAKKFILLDGRDDISVLTNKALKYISNGR